MTAINISIFLIDNTLTAFGVVVQREMLRLMFTKEST